MAIPEFSLVRPDLIKPLLSQVIPPTRLGDNMKLEPDGPQEMEMGLANMCPYSFFHYFIFPGHVREHIGRVSLDGFSARTVAYWREKYMEIVRRATYLSGGKPLVLKDPPHAARIPILLEMFPNAKFAYTRRNPYYMFLSVHRFFKIAIHYLCVQEISEEDFEAGLFQLYDAMVRKYLVDKALIPAGNLIELDFEDLEADPIGEVRRVYSGLDLPGFAAAEPRIRAYVDETAGYKKNPHVLTPDVIHKVNQNWGFIFDVWGYERLGEATPRYSPGHVADTEGTPSGALAPAPVAAPQLAV
jgi:hypothetical protein